MVLSMVAGFLGAVQSKQTSSSKLPVDLSMLMGKADGVAQVGCPIARGQGRSSSVMPPLVTCPGVSARHVPWGQSGQSTQRPAVYNPSKYRIQQQGFTQQRKGHLPHAAR